MLQVNVGSVYSSVTKDWPAKQLRESFSKHSIAAPLVRPPMFWLVLERAKSGSVLRMLNDQLRALIQLIERNNLRLIYISPIQLKGTVLVIVDAILSNKLT